MCCLWSTLERRPHQPPPSARARGACEELFSRLNRKKTSMHMSQSPAASNISDLSVPDDQQTQRDGLTDKNPHNQPSALTILLCFHDNWPQHGSEGNTTFCFFALPLCLMRQTGSFCPSTCVPSSLPRPHPRAFYYSCDIRADEGGGRLCVDSLLLSDAKLLLCAVM